MSKENKKSTASQNRLSKKERWGQICFLLAAFLNTAALGLNLYVSNLEEDLSRTRRDEQYYMRNDQIAYFDNLVGTLIEGSIYELEMIRRLAWDRLSAQEKELLSQRLEKLNNYKEGSFRHMVLTTYFMVNDPPEGLTIDELFVKISNDSLEVLYPRFEKAANDLAKKLKGEMNRLSDKVSFWNVVALWVIGVSTLVILLGDWLTFIAGKSIDAEIPQSV